MSESETSAEAVKEVAKTAGKAIDAASGVGRFLARVIGAPLEELGGMWFDHVRYLRAERLIHLHRRFDELRAAAGLSGDLRRVEPKVALSLIEAASIEEDDDLQDLYARLLVNLTNPGNAVEAKRAFVTILQDFGPLEARLLQMLCDAPGAPQTVQTAGLPHKYLDETNVEGNVRSPSEGASLALWNLARLGCVAPAGTWGGGSTVAVVSVTELGRALYRACTVERRDEDGPTREPPRPAPMAETDWGVRWRRGEDGVGVVPDDVPEPETEAK
jgi:Abortive infection alpha